MCRRNVFIVAACSLLAAGIASGVAPAAEPVTSLVAQATRAGLRVLEGSHLTLITDRPARSGDGVEDLPRLFDEAFAAWCRHYGLDPAAHGAWRAVGCLVVDKERFRAAGLLPVQIPDFKNGFCANDRFWLMDQSNPAYRRHLLLHEGVHAFTLTLLHLDTQPWYTEGIAELLATHRLDGPAAVTRFVATPMPRDAADVEQLGRIESIRAARAAGTLGSLGEVFTAPPARNHELTAYASNWAAVAMLSLHPRYADAFARAERGGLDAGFTVRLTGGQGWDAAQATRDFDAFTDDIDYGYDFARSAIDWSPAAPLTGRQGVEVAADRGWQHGGLALQKGRGYEVHATGRVRVGQAANRPLASEPGGISISWYRGHPLGRLLAAQWVEPGPGQRPRFVVVAAGDGGTFTAAADGPLYFKVNESPGQLGDNEGSFRATVAPAARP